MRSLIGTIFCLMAFMCFASETQEVTWDDLIPEQPQIEDPFASMDPNQLSDLSDVYSIRNMRDQNPEQIDARKYQAMLVITARLQEQGLDVDSLLDKAEEIGRLRRQAENAVDTELDGKKIKIPGYIVPLEYEGEAVKDFLLVPYYGACIHTPPPPPNQMVHVNVAKAVSGETLFMPVWISGVLKTETKTSDLTLVDGSSDVNSGYSMQSAEVEPYE